MIRVVAGAEMDTCIGKIFTAAIGTFVDVEAVKAIGKAEDFRCNQYALAPRAETNNTTNPITADTSYRILHNITSG